MMTKRAGSFEENNGKRTKIDEEDDWGSEVDEAALAQVFDIYESSQKENTLHAPATYNVFKQPGTYFAASTQLSTSITATYSSRKPVPDLEVQIKKLELQNKEKEGEIAILREKLKETKSTVQTEHNKTTAEWRQKLAAVERQVNTTKSELEFKNLEIGNLKQQIADLRRQRRLDLNNTQVLSQFFPTPALPPAKKVEEICSRSPEKSIRKEANVHKQSKTGIILDSGSDSVYTLQSQIPGNLFLNFSKEKHLWKVNSPKISRNTIPYLQNQCYKSDTLFQHQCIDLSQDSVEPEHFYHDFLSIMTSSTDELNSLEKTEAIKRMVTLSIVEINDLNDFLMKFGNSLKTEEVKQMDVNYLLRTYEAIADFSAWEFPNDKFGMKCSKFLTLFSKVLPYNKFLQNCVLSNKCSDVDFLYKNSDSWQKEFRKYDNYFLEQTLNIVTSIGKYRQSTGMTAFLCSVVKFLISITKLRNAENVLQKYFPHFFREIVCARPEPEVIYELTFFIKNTAKYPTVIKFFFEKDYKIPREVIKKSTINYKVEGSCAFCIFHLLYQITLLKAKNLPIAVCINVLSFIHTTFKNFSSMHHDRTNVCICQSQLYTVAIETIFNMMERFVHHYDTHKRYDSNLNEWNNFLNEPFVIKVLNLMSFNSYDVLEKFLMVYAKFKEIQSILKDNWEFFDAEVSTNADLPEIPESKFKEIEY